MMNCYIPFRNNPKNLNPSQDGFRFLGVFWSAKAHLRAESHETDLHISGGFGKETLNFNAVYFTGSLC